MSWQALKWARKQQAGGLAKKALLTALADYASERGRVFATQITLAKDMECNPKTVALHLPALIADGLLIDTGKRTGPNGQTPIYQLPIGATTDPRLTPDSPQTDTSLTTKSGSQFIGETDPNPDPLSLNPKEYHDQGAAKTYGTSIPHTSHSTSESSSSEGHQYQDAPAQNHPKWPEFVAYCRSQPDKHGQPGQPTAKGFTTWLDKQTPYWRNKVRPKPEGEHGYVVDGKFLTDYEANEYAKQHSELLDQGRFREATRHNDKIKIK